MCMALERTQFRREPFGEYASWFADSELDRHLGPMDNEWLEAVLAEPESAGATWAVFRGAELVAVVETAFDPEQHSCAGIRAVAVKPGLRRHGIGATVLKLILALHKDKGFVEHVAYISVNNHAGQQCARKAGFVAVASEPDERGYIEFRHR